MIIIDTNKDQNQNSKIEKVEGLNTKKTMHHPWVGGVNEKGEFNVTDSHGNRAFHPYTEIGFKFGQHG